MNSYSTITKFIEEFKDTSYYQNLLNSAEVVFIYMGGSMCSGITDERSDYDIVIVTLNGESYIDASRYEYLMYEGRKVHWYYRSIKGLFETNHKNMHAHTGAIWLRNLCDNMIIYENPKYKDIWQDLYAVKDRLSDLGMYRLFEVQKDYIDKVINEGKVLEKHYTKYLYHLCLASYYLTREESDKDFLRVLKRIRWQPVPDEYKQLAVKRLKILKNYIEAHPIELDRAFNDLYMELNIQE